MNIKLGRRIGYCLISFVFCAGFVIANQTPDDSVWESVDTTPLNQRGIDSPEFPRAYRTFRLKESSLDSILMRAPEEFRAGAPVILNLPMPDGSLGRFRIEHSLVVEPGLLADYPELGATYRGQGVDDPTATVRFDMMPTGFHAIVLSAGDTVYVEPYSRGNTLDYISFYHNDSPPNWFATECMVKDTDDFRSKYLGLLSGQSMSPSVISGANLRTYRLALGVTAEYTQAYGGGTVSGSLAAITTTLNFLDAIYEREVAIHIVLVNDESSLIFTDTATDGYTHENIASMLTENQTKLDTVIGSGNYEIGHVFDGTILGGGSFSFQGQAGAIGNVCVAGGKARGVDIFRSVTPGDVIAYYNFAHELGHQFGATHTMNGTGTGCAGARTSITAYEPGSGSTIMGYRWNCAAQDLRSSDTYFHNASLEQIVTYSTVGAGSCVAPVASGNHEPTVNAGANFTIPKNTPFALTATSGDVDGDTVSYTWEEADLGPASPPDTDTDGQARPILRSFLATTNPTRTFPSLTYILNNANVPPTSGPCPIGGGTCLIGEALPSITRTMNFRVTARDGRAIGGVNSAAMQVSVDGNSGPFGVSSPTTSVTYAGGSAQTVTWNVANTSGAPVNASNVKISYSSNGGTTFSNILLPSTPNDGTQAVTIPAGNTTTARVKVEAVGNVFFDISDSNFTVSGATTPRNLHTSSDSDGDGRSDVSVWREGEGNWYYLNSLNGLFGAAHFGAAGDRIVPGDYDGDGKTDSAVWRPAGGVWYMQRSTTGFSAFQFGLSADLPAQGDFDGDGHTDIAVFRPSSGTWFLQQSTAGFAAVQFGANGDRPVPGDYDGDGRTDIAVYRPSEGNWYQLRSTQGFAAFHFGIPADKVVPADFDGDGKTDLGVYRDGAPGIWYLLQSLNGFTAISFGTTGDIPAPGDFDGDGKTDPTVFRPSNGIWFSLQTTSGFVATQFGLNSDKPVPAGYVPVQ